MSFRLIADAGIHPRPTSVVMGKDVAERSRKIVHAACKTAGIECVVIVEPSMLTASHNNAWASAKSLINRL